MSRAQTISDYAVWLAVAVDRSAEERAVPAHELSANAAAPDSGDARPDLIPHPAHRILHRALRPAG